MSTEKTTKEKIHDIIREQVNLPKDRVIQDDHNIVEDLGLDSLDTVEVIMEIEVEFDIEIDDADAEKHQMVGSLVDYVEERIAGK